MKLLVTGCAGLIGASVCARAVKDGHDVTGVDDLNGSCAVLLKQWRLARLERAPGFRFVRADIADRPAVDDLFAGGGIEAVINLAARAGVRPSVVDPLGYYHTNVIGTLTLLEQCRAHGVAKFILASSSSVYGDGPRPFREDQPADRPLSPYAASKKAAENLCYTYSRLHGIDVTVFRYFTVYGPAGRPDMSPFRFIRSLAEDEPIVLYGDGCQERDFTYVDDVARGTLLGLRPLGHEVINLGSDRPVRMLDVIRILERLTGRSARVLRREGHASDVRATWADIGKAQRCLAWAPAISLEEGLHAAVQWYADNRSWASRIALGDEEIRQGVGAASRSSRTSS